MQYYGQIMTKVQLTLTPQEEAMLTSIGDKFGYNLSRTVKYVISKEVDQAIQSGVIPTYKMSKETEEAGLQALKEYREGKTIAVDDIDKFFDESKK